MGYIRGFCNITNSEVREHYKLTKETQADTILDYNFICSW